MQASSFVFFLLGLGLVSAKPMDREAINPLQLSTFKGYEYDYSLGGKHGAYQFYYVLPTHSRHEERNDDGEVKGSYSFIAPEGEEFEFKYQADKEGFKVESNALPTPVEDTEEVRQAKEIFFEAYKKQLELVSDEDDDEESSEESSEESDEDEESSEESSEESDEDSDEEEEEEEEGNKDDAQVKQFLTRTRDYNPRANRVVANSIFFKPATHSFKPAKLSPKPLKPAATRSTSRTAKPAAQRLSKSFKKPVFNKGLTPRTFTSSRGSKRRSYIRN